MGPVPSKFPSRAEDEDALPEFRRDPVTRERLIDPIFHVPTGLVVNVDTAKHMNAGTAKQEHGHTSSRADSEPSEPLSNLTEIAELLPTCCKDQFTRRVLAKPVYHFETRFIVNEDTAVKYEATLHRLAISGLLVRGTLKYDRGGRSNTSLPPFVPFPHGTKTVQSMARTVHKIKALQKRSNEMREEHAGLRIGYANVEKEGDGITKAFADGGKRYAELQAERNLLKERHEGAQAFEDWEKRFADLLRHQFDTLMRSVVSMKDLMDLQQRIMGVGKRLDELGEASQTLELELFATLL